MRTVRLRDNRKNPRRIDGPIVTCRFLTVEEAKSLRCGDRVLFQGADGSLCEVKVNGEPKTWKREPNRVVVPWKYGLYNYGQEVTIQDGEEFYLNRFIKIIG